MDILDNDFFEEYKRLDKLLKDMGYADGVKEYIEQMRVHSLGSSRDYENLQHCKHLRDTLAHDIVFSLCEQQDLDFITDFYSRVYNCADPVAAAHKAMRAKETENDNKAQSRSRIKSVYIDNTGTINNTASKKNKKNFLSAEAIIILISVFLISAAIIAAIIYFLK